MFDVSPFSRRLIHHHADAANITSTTAPPTAAMIAITVVDRDDDDDDDEEDESEPLGSLADTPGYAEANDSVELAEEEEETDAKIKSAICVAVNPVDAESVTERVMELELVEELVEAIDTASVVPVILSTISRKACCQAVLETG